MSNGDFPVDPVERLRARAEATAKPSENYPTQNWPPTWKALAGLTASDAYRATHDPDDPIAKEGAFIESLVGWVFLAIVIGFVGVLITPWAFVVVPAVASTVITRRILRRRRVVNSVRPQVLRRAPVANSESPKVTPPVSTRVTPVAPVANREPPEAAPPLSSDPAEIARFSGTTMKRSAPFTIPSGTTVWSIRWKIETDDYGSIWLQRPPDEPVAKVISTERAGEDETYFYEPGTFFLDVDVDGPWTAAVVVHPDLANS